MTLRENRTPRSKRSRFGEVIVVCRQSVALGAVVAVVLGAPAVAEAADPAVSTDGVEVTGATTARVGGNADPEGPDTLLHIDYALASNVWCRSAGKEGRPLETNPRDLGGGYTMYSEILVKLEDLVPGRSYCVELVARNEDGTTYGGVVDFTTGPAQGPIPSIGELEPDVGSTLGGTRIVISGDILENMRFGSVYFGSVKGRIVAEECDGLCEIMPYTSLVVESPPHEAGTVDVTVQNNQGYVSAINPGDRFSYVQSPGEEPSEVYTEPAQRTANGFLLKGRLNPGGLPTHYYFIYKDHGPECEDMLGCGPETIHAGPLEGNTEQEVPPIEVTNLEAGKTYLFWLIAYNSRGYVRGHGEFMFVAGSPPAAPTARDTGGSPPGTAAGLPLGTTLGGPGLLGAATLRDSATSRPRRLRPKGSVKRRRATRAGCRRVMHRRRGHASCRRRSGRR